MTSTCQHPECHAPGDCPICRASGLQFCLHRPCRRAQAAAVPGSGQEQETGAPMATLLKAAFLAGAVLLVWLLARGAGRPDTGTLAPGPADFTPWQPLSE